MSDEAAAALKQMAAIQALNLQIVAARKRGDDGEVRRLKAQVQALLRVATSSPDTLAAPLEDVVPSAAPGSSFGCTPSTVELRASAASLSTEVVTHSTRQLTDAGDSLRVMAALHEVNLAIVEARQAGDDARVQRLKAEAQRLIALGRQQR